MTFCEKCGAELSDGVKFCQVCGAPVDNNTQANSDGFSGNVLGSEARDNEKVEKLIRRCLIEFGADKPLIETEHYACDVWYIKNLKEEL